MQARKIKQLLTLLLISVWMFAPGGGAWAAPIVKTALEHYEQGRDLMAAGECRQAIKFFAKARDIDSNDRRVRVGMMFVEYKPNEKTDECRRILAEGGEEPSPEDYLDALTTKITFESHADKDGPEIVLYEPAVRRGLSRIIEQSAELAIRGMARDTSGIAFVRVNDKDIFVDADGNFSGTAPIFIGLNPLVIETADGLGNRSRLSLMVQKDRADSPHVVEDHPDGYYRKSFAVVIGINDYHEWPRLEFAVNDAKSVAHALKTRGFDDIRLLLNQDASKSGILRTLFFDLAKKVGTDDRVLVYFAGHGQTQELPNGGKKGYIIPVDGDESDLSTAISMEQVKSLSSSIPAKHILYAMDSCYSGLGLNRSLGQSPAEDGYLRKMASLRAIQIITAGGKGEQVVEKDGHGLFTSYFLDALGGKADFNRDGAVTGTELGAYLRPAVSTASQHRQTPLYGRFEGEGEFIFSVR